jgi:hypothetical protein
MEEAVRAAGSLSSTNIPKSARPPAVWNAIRRIRENPDHLPTMAEVTRSRQRRQFEVTVRSSPKSMTAVACNAWKPVRPGG